jgi:hypothetical protein
MVSVVALSDGLLDLSKEGNPYIIVSHEHETDSENNKGRLT